MLARSPSLRRRLGDAAQRSAAARTWDRALDRLAEGYRDVLAESRGEARDAA
jgi:hypothetical protein